MIVGDSKCHIGIDSFSSRSVLVSSSYFSPDDIPTFDVIYMLTFISAARGHIDVHVEASFVVLMGFYIRANNPSIFKKKASRWLLLRSCITIIPLKRPIHKCHHLRTFMLYTQFPYPYQ